MKPFPLRGKSVNMRRLREGKVISGMLELSRIEISGKYLWISLF